MTDREQQVLRLVLGELSGEERERLEEELFASDDLLGELLGIEEELAEGLLDGRLPVEMEQRLRDAWPRIPAWHGAAPDLATLRGASRLQGDLQLVAVALLAGRFLRLAAGLERSPGAVPSVELSGPGGPVVVELAAPLLAELEAKEAVVAVEDTAGERPATVEPVRVDRGSSTVLVTLPSEALARGLVRVRLSARLDSGETEEIDDYFFQVTRA